MILYSTTTAAKKKFRTRLEDELDLSNLRMKERADKAKKKFREHLIYVKEHCNTKKKYAKLAAEKNLITKEKAEFRTQHEGNFLPNPKEAISAYLSTKESQQVLRQLEEYSSKGKVLKDYQMSRLTQLHL